MTQQPQPPTPGQPRTRDQRAQAVVERVIARRRGGEFLPDEQVLQQHPDLLGVLEGQLRKAAFLESLRPTPDRLAQLLDRMESDPELDAPQPARPAAANGGGGCPTPQGRVDHPRPLAGPHAKLRSTPAEPPLPAEAPPVDAPPVDAPPVDAPPASQDPQRLGESPSGSRGWPPRAGHDDAARITYDEVGAATPDASRFSTAELDGLAATDFAEGVGASDSAGGPAVEGGHFLSSATHREPAGAPQEPSTLYRAPGYGDATRFRPRNRPPMAVLQVLDDGQASGELVRLRKDLTTLGREQADVCVPHDAMVSALHAQIERVREADAWRWVLRDGQSTNGVFVKARKIRLRDGDQLIIASRIVQFSQPSPEGPARLDEVVTQGMGEWLDLDGEDRWIGRDQAICEPFLASEPMLDQRFARLSRRADGRWTIWSQQSLNGLWVRVTQVKLVSGSMFQLGEQRFAFHTP
ncbi:MAG: FHA domain-containing protein [Planctomycetota bacterium]